LESALNFFISESSFKTMLSEENKENDWADCVLKKYSRHTCEMRREATMKDLKNVQDYWYLFLGLLIISSMIYFILYLWLSNVKIYS